MATKRRPAKPRTKTPARVRKRAATRKSSRGRGGRARSHHNGELAGLALVALGVFLACVLWFGLSGGPIADALTSVVGSAAYIAPVVLLPLGGLMVARSALVDVRPFRLGLAVALGGLMLTLGDAHGGDVGSLLETLVAKGLGTTGATILGVTLAVAGVLFLTGASLGAILRRSGHAVRTASRHVRRPTRSATENLAPTPTPTRAAPPVDVKHDFPDLVTDGVSAPPPILAAASAPEGEDATAATQPFAQVGQQTLFERAPTHAAYKLPDRGLLKVSKRGSGPTADANERVAAALVQCLAHFGVDATVIGQISGPRVTRYELQLAPGTKVGKVAGLKDDLSYALATTEIRILAPIPGKQAVGVEVPNLSPNLVTLGDIYDDLPPTASPLAVWLGKDISGAAVWADLARMPHLLIAGTTGSGKSGCINTILTSILLRATPDDARLILVDPKRIELNYYESIPHLLTPVVSSPKEASAVLLNVVTEMDRRYERLSQVRARNLPEANRAFRKRGEEELPYLLVVIDELADLMMVSPQEVEDAIIRLAQKSRAVGIHLVLATQRPSVDVITGMIKANVPSRIAFAVSSQTDSRVILDQNGAESLLGQGDMLFKPLGTSRLQRVQGAFVTEEEIAMIVEQARAQREQEVDPTFLEAPQVFAQDDGDGEGGDFDPDEDPLLDKAIEIVVQTQTASVSLIQRRLRVGYTRAGRLIDMLERRGIISGYEGSKPRRVLVAEHELERILSVPD
ncbi:MAG TPA: DNA translocase FtsK 4TM domain-containing protein [Gaiellaceae bacterium]|nr:DNA translocase FtsK 4TM domain-containing protein [Gaiellaceae bacterium]